LEQRAVLTLLRRHVPKSGRDLERFGFAESGEHFRKLIIDFRVTFLDEDRDMQSLL